MKALTTLAAVAALIAGLSVASAADSSINKSTTSSSSSMSKSTAEVTGTGKFCIKGSSGALNCQYASLSACKKAVTGSESCEANPNATATTGSKY